MSPENKPQIPGAYPESPVSEGEPKFSILPHPAKSNDPSDLGPPGDTAGSGGKLRMDPLKAAFNAPGPFIPTENMANSLEKPLSREELQVQAAALNKES